MGGFVRYPHLVVKVMHKGVEIKVEKKCSTCAFGALDEDQGDCKICFEKYTEDTPYTMWKLDPEYDESDDVF